ncbi:MULTISPECIES: CoA pyrophosphatase [Shewanella]|jgi:8-oxo-dGTP pyrophosphatase MutT (NUDIX family)|uniref:NUDIX hydrolase n=2 Tax=Shewanella putrefaciens TaxID=24 RepID=A4Y6E6_SHEPC|nr:MULTISPECIES: CoA pyrophosphatase [Shewanella]CAD6365530.1 putative Nudix hydrolase NudL [Shewanella hafniensis]ABM25045.1 NUDIX hydrolase [Shewanella sp. W3-18-1]AVV82511.1 NUDIX hydrolase NUDIX hydrolase [Shewanella putrefaciens]MCK7628696.1 CoA pyrophosphatase [Shewanella sp. JNE9-1]MCK7633043.1 CoA pyrophosphatase [Shewanella sp. JNE17]
MDQAEFRLRFNLHPLARQDPAAFPHLGLRKAAVLLPVQDIAGELSLILTQRPMHLRAHPGQISFPGGKIEPSDTNAIAAALREAEEEIGLLRHNVDVVGTFPAHNTFTGFEITPVIGIVKQAFVMKLDPGEVADCFSVPLSFFIEPTHRHQKRFLRQGRYYNVHFIPYQQRFIWGATAAIIDHLCRHLSIPSQI